MTYRWRIYLLLVLVLLLSVRGSYVIVPVHAATKEPSPEICVHAATADSIKIYYCENIHLFVNQLGFMAFEP